MRITIVTISFNQAQFLEKALLSVLEQGDEDLEYIVVDPGSTDGSREIIERYRERLSRVIFEPDSGPADGLNRGFSQASGDIFGYLNSDDLLLPGALAGVRRAYRAHPDADLVYGHGYVIDGAGHVTGRCRSDRFSLRRSAYGNSIIMQQAAFWRRRAYEAVGGFHAANRLSWDGEFWIDMAMAGKRFVRVDEYWASFRVHHASITENFHKGPQRARYEAEQARLFAKVTGRARRATDWLAHVETRIEKWLVDPLNLWLRLKALVGR